LDFDFVASSNELLSELKQNSSSSLDKYSCISKNSSDMENIHNIINYYKENNIQKAKALYSHLQEYNKLFFKEHFKEIYNSLH